MRDNIVASNLKGKTIKNMMQQLVTSRTLFLNCFVILVRKVKLNQYLKKKKIYVRSLKNDISGTIDQLTKKKKSYKDIQQQMRKNILKELYQKMKNY